MLLHDKHIELTDYLKDWPLHYYEIPTATQRMELLTTAGRQGMVDETDLYRKELCKKRFFSINTQGTVDAFMHAWMMIKASGAAGVSFLQKKKLKRELEQYMAMLCIIDFEPANEKALAIRTEEWHDFARCFIHSCSESKAYCSTLFGFVPIKDSVIAQKIATEILLVTVEYPEKFGLASEFFPFAQAMSDVYYQMIEHGETYLHLPALP